jgi:membrane-bound ClpP family serine protease
LNRILEADFVTYLGPIADITPDIFKGMLEGVEGSRRDKLAVFLETNGGFIESAERIANILRHHYPTVEFLVTSYAMSAGTVLVMSGDAILMDYSATLGPIDPQWRRPGSDS